MTGPYPYYAGPNFGFTAVVGVPWSYQLQGEFGTNTPYPPLFFANLAVYSGQSGFTPAPAWLSMSAAGLLTGTPPTAELERVYFSVYDQSDTGSSGEIFLTIQPASLPEIANPSPLNAVMSGMPLNLQLSVTGGYGPFTFMLIAGGITPNTENWLSLSSTGLLSGAVPQGLNETETFTIQVTDSFGQTSTSTFTLQAMSPSANCAPYTALITSEHNQKPKFMALVSCLTGDMGDVVQAALGLNQAFDLDLAAGAQLNVVGQWVGQSRVVPNVITAQFFGFADNAFALAFGELSNPSIGGRFYDLGETFTASTILSDPEYGAVLRAKIIQNQANGTLADIEAALQFIFGVNCAVIDPGNLVINIIVDGGITLTELSILQEYDLLPRPAGVRIGSVTSSGGAGLNYPIPGYNPYKQMPQLWDPAFQMPQRAPNRP